MKAATIRVLIVLCMALSVYAVAVAGPQDQPKRPMPMVTEVQKLQAQTYLQAMQIAQYKAQLASQEFDKAKASLTSLAQALQVEGYTLDMDTWTYTAVDAPAK